MTPHPMSYQNRALFVWMLMGSIWTMLSALAQYFSGLCKSDLRKSWEFAWRRRETNFSPAFSLCPWTGTSCLLLLSNHHLIFCLIFSLHLSYNWSPCLLQRFSFSISLSLLLLFCLLCKPVANPTVSSQPLLSLSSASAVCYNILGILHLQRLPVFSFVTKIPTDIYLPILTVLCNSRKRRHLCPPLILFKRF